jgi:voltage-gated potassium channel
MRIVTPNPFKPVRYGFLLVIAIFVYGVAGYVFLEHYKLLDAIYMTVITVGTVGFSEVNPLSDTGKIFTISLILLSISVITYFLTLVSRFLLDGDFIQYYKIYRMNQKLEQIQNHVIICGYGRNGREAASVLMEKKIQVVTIEEKHDKYFEESPLILMIEADATREDTLLKAGIDKARALITTLPNDADNVYVVLTAREMRPDLPIISRASMDSSVNKLKTAGASNIIMPDKLGGAQMATLVLSPDIKELLDIMSVQHSDSFAIREFICPLSGSLDSMNIRRITGSTVLAIKNQKGSYILNPALDTFIESGDKLIAMGSEMQLQAMNQLLGDLNS